MEMALSLKSYSELLVRVNSVLFDTVLHCVKRANVITSYSIHYTKLYDLACVSREPGKEFGEISNNTYADKWQVIFFWPEDFTFICPTEIAEFV